MPIGDEKITNKCYFVVLLRPVSQSVTLNKSFFSSGHMIASYEKPSKRKQTDTKKKMAEKKTV